MKLAQTEQNHFIFSHIEFLPPSRCVCVCLPYRILETLCALIWRKLRIKRLACLILWALRSFVAEIAVNAIMHMVNMRGGIKRSQPCSSRNNYNNFDGFNILIFALLCIFRITYDLCTLRTHSHIADRELIWHTKITACNCYFCWYVFHLFMLYVYAFRQL